VKLTNFYSGLPTRVKRHEVAIELVARRLWDGHGVTITAVREDGRRVQLTLSADELAQLVANGGLDA
jgi:hypothetical protein